MTDSNTPTRHSEHRYCIRIVITTDNLLSEEEKETVAGNIVEHIFEERRCDIHGFAKIEETDAEIIAADYISIEWSVEDVQQERPDLTPQQCRAVLQEVEERHDASISINWGVIECAAEKLYPQTDSEAE